MTPTDSCQGTEQLPYYTYDLTGSDWSATFVVVDSDCFISSYQKVDFPNEIRLKINDQLTMMIRIHLFTITRTRMPAMQIIRFKLTSLKKPLQNLRQTGNSFNCTTGTTPCQKTTLTCNHSSTLLCNTTVLS
jgi:hypothetical protein